MKSPLYRAGNSFAILCALLLCAAMANAEVVVIVSAKSRVTMLTSEQAAQIFLGKTGTFPNGEQALPLDLPEGVPIRSEFYEKVANKNPKQLLAYRANMVFSGKGQIPKELNSSKEVKKLVAENPSAIGYIEKSLVDETVRVVLTQP